MKRIRFALVAAVVLVIVVVVVTVQLRLRAVPWTEGELATIQSLSIHSLPALLPDPSNAYADDPRAAELGQALFFDTRLSANGQVSCASCHIPERMFTDGRALGRGIGTTDRKTPTIVGTAYSPWQFWDGRADSQWSQALGPLESAVEHGGARTQYAHVIAEHYRAEYESIFGPLPDLSDSTRFPSVAGPVADAQARAAWEAMLPEDRETVTEIFVNVGKALAAYERQIMFGPSRFDQYAEALSRGDWAAAEQALTAEEVLGLRLFIGEAQCINCHNGALFTNNDFRNIGVPAVEGLPPDAGRASGVQQLLESEFNCASPYSDAAAEDCAELRFLRTGDHTQEGAFKTPTLRNVVERAPYMHAGQFATLREVIEHYDQAPEAAVGHSELQPLGLSEEEMAALEAFLRTLSGPLATPPELLRAPD